MLGGGRCRRTVGGGGTLAAVAGTGTGKLGGTPRTIGTPATQRPIGLLGPQVNQRFGRIDRGGHRARSHDYPVGAVGDIGKAVSPGGIGLDGTGA